MNTRRVTALISLGLVGAVVIGIIATSGNDGSTDPATAEPDTANVAEPGDVDESSGVAVVDPNLPDLANRGPHPEFLEVEGWLQSDVTSLDELRGKVVAVQFWTFGCSNCKATLPHMQDLYAKYGGANFEIVGVHAPEFDFERQPEAIAQAARDLGVTWPIALDTEKLNFRSWQERRFWPRLFLLDQEGNVRYDHIGEGAYEEIDAAVGALIAEGGA